MAPASWIFPISNLTRRSCGVIGNPGTGRNPGLCEWSACEFASKADAVDPFVDQLKHLCVAQPTRSKWIFVPAHAIGRTLGERIAREGTNWLNLRFVTPLDIALRMGAPFLVERGIDPSGEGLGPALMMRLLLDLPLEHGYFRPLADHPTMAQALWTTVRELLMAGVRPEALKAECFASPASWQTYWSWRKPGAGADGLATPVIGRHSRLRGATSACGLPPSGG